MKDHIIRGITENREVRFFAAYTREICETARTTHGLSPVCTAALGRLLTAGAIMGAMCKNESDVLTLRIEGDGPLSKVTVTADAHCHVKGLVSATDIWNAPKANGHLDVGGAIGKGTLFVIRDTGLAEPYVGQTKLVSGEIAEDLTYYFASSEQIPTSVGLGVLIDRNLTVQHAGGFLIQLMPFASDETVSRLEKSLTGMESVTEFFRKGKTPEDMMREILGSIIIEEERDTEYHCSCSRERVERVLISLGKENLEEMIEDGDPVTMHCDFCNTDYTFSVDELKEILAKA
jgi:molecular chaperone Hsp33